MLTQVLDCILFFVATSPIVGWLAQKTQSKRGRELYAIIALILTGYALLELSGQVKQNNLLVIKNLSFGPPIGTCLEIDMLSIFMAFIIVMLGILVAVYSIFYMEHDSNLTEYYTLLLGMVAGTIGVVFAGDFFTFFIFWELMCITSYVLVAFRKERAASIEASFKYLIMSTFGSVTLLLAMSLLYGMTGTLDFAYLSLSMRGATASYWLYLTITLIIVGFGIKSAMVPFHTWLPDAYPEAPSSISALFAGVSMICGIYGLSRVLMLLFNSILIQWGLIVAVLSVLNMTVGNFLALLQNDIKRLLAYSSIAHVGYILAGVAIGTSTGLAGAFLHIFNYSLMKGLAFLCAGAFIYRAGTRKINELEGIGRRMPLAGLSLCIALLALLGVPTLNGFISKFIILKAAIETQQFLLAIIFVFNSVFSAAYYIRLIQVVMLGSPNRKIAKIRDVPILMGLPIALMAILIVIFGVYPQPILSFAESAAKAATSLQDYVKAVVG